MLGHTGCIYSVCVSRDGSLVGSGGEDKVVRVYRIDYLHSLQGRDNPFENNKKFKRELSYEKKDNLEVDMTEYKGNKGLVWCVAFNYKGDKIVSGGVDMIIRIFDLKTGRV